ncbi:MAG: polysaccharide biosynthesis tyrosine autokinase [Planctomycetes bacterium]|nr:polysaccharide biosynthesis tyrosine autokinase [Planctomycetota bacterium]
MTTFGALDRTPDAGRSLREYAAAIWRRRWLVLLLVLVGGGAGFWQGRRSPDVYAVATRIDIAKPRPFAGAAPTLAFGESYHESQLYYPTRYALLSSRTYVDRLLGAVSTKEGRRFPMWDWLTWPAYRSAPPREDPASDLGPGVKDVGAFEDVVGLSVDEFARRFSFRRHGPKPSPQARFDDPSDLADFLANRVNVKPEKNTTLVAIELEGEDREVLAPLVNLLVDVFWREQRSETQRRLERERRFWVARRLALVAGPAADPTRTDVGETGGPEKGSRIWDAKAELDGWKTVHASDANRLDLVRSARSQQVLDSDRQLRELEERLGAARPDLEALVPDLAGIQARAADAAARDVAAPGAAPAGEERARRERARRVSLARDAAVEKALADVERDATAVLTGATPVSRYHALAIATSDPAVGPLLARLQSLEAGGSKEPAVLDPVRKALNAAVRDAVLRRTRELRRDVALRILLSERLARDDAELEEQWKLASDLAQRQTAYDGLLADLAKVDTELGRIESQISVEKDLRPLKVIEPASDPSRPVKPNRPLLILVGLGAGLLLGLALALLRDWLDDTITGLEDVARHVGAPVFGSILAIDPKEADTIAATKLTSGVTEAFRAVRTSLEFAGRHEPGRGRVILVTSCAPREGKTTVAANLAQVLAQDGKRTLLVDADLRKPRVHRVVGLPEGKGLSNLIHAGARLEDVVLRKDDKGPFVVTSGPPPPNPAELLGRPETRALLESLRTQFDRIVLDSPPVGVVTDAAVLAPLVDQVLLVVASGRTKKQAAEIGASLLRSVGAPPTGVVVNLVSRDRSGGYGGYYHRDAEAYYGGRSPGADA